MSAQVYFLAVTIGAMFTSGTYLVLQRDVVRVVWGVVLMSQAANVYLVTMGGLGGSAPIIAGNETLSDPLVQALVLTAIVISFGVTAFALVLVYRMYQEHGTIDLDEFGRKWRENRVEGDSFGLERVSEGGEEND